MLVDPIVNPVVTGFIGKKQSDAPALFAKFFAGIVGLLLIIASIWAFVHILIGGIEWMTSGGDKGKLETAQHHITSAFVGLLIVFSAWAIYLLFLQFLGLSPVGLPGGGIQLKFPTLL
jgi:hypothetical protein